MELSSKRKRDDAPASGSVQGGEEASHTHTPPKQVSILLKARYHSKKRKDGD